jgi:hypothetical protein
VEGACLDRLLERRTALLLCQVSQLHPRSFDLAVEALDQLEPFTGDGPQFGDHVLLLLELLRQQVDGPPSALRRAVKLLDQRQALFGGE